LGGPAYTRQVFNVGPMEFLVLAVVGLIVLGPDRLPGLARDAARLIRTLRDMATGARAQLREELGPEFADVDLRSLHPRTVLQRAVLGDDVDLRSLDPRSAIQRAVLGADEAPASNGASPRPVSMDKPVTDKPVSTDKPMSRDRPLGRGEQAPFDDDAT
jgi:sec-independent protein translocase protein TatB